MTIHQNQRKTWKMASLWQIFLTFSKIGAFTIGGGYAMLPVIRNEIIRKGWLDENDFTDIITLAQTAPGLLAVNISIFTGYRLRGTKGSVIATLGSILPSFAIILAIAMLFTGFQDNPTIAGIFKGIRPVVVALIAVPMLQMAKTANKNWWSWGICLATMGLVAFLKVSPIYILLVIIVVTASVENIRTHRKKEDGQ